MPYRPVYLLVYNSRVFAAHWSMWIPNDSTDTPATEDIGKIIQVTGDSLKGFVHEFVRNHDIVSRYQYQGDYLPWLD